MRSKSPRQLACADLDRAIADATRDGYRLDMIMPADAPRMAMMSRGDECLLLELDHGPPPVPSYDASVLIISRADGGDDGAMGRAGMIYRDLLPDRLGGRLIASHIGIGGSGPVDDYVHYHRIGFQMIYCQRGWVRVVYEDQGPPFVMRPGDCVLQPPTIRHRVLESGDDLEVIEIALPAEHETYRDHELTLPNALIQPDRSYGGQQFVRHQAEAADWAPSRHEDFEARDTGIRIATGGRFSVQVLRAGDTTVRPREGRRQLVASPLQLLHVLSGEVCVDATTLGSHQLSAGDTCVIPSGTEFRLLASGACSVLEVEQTIT